MSLHPLSALEELERALDRAVARIAAGEIVLFALAETLGEREPALLESVLSRLARQIVESASDPDRLEELHRLAEEIDQIRRTAALPPPRRP